MAKLDIGNDFSKYPAGRYFSDDTPSGEEFREDYLMPRLRDLSAGQQLTIVLDSDVESYGSSFLTEAFAGVVKYGYMSSDELKSKIRLEYSDEDYDFFARKILQYIDEASFDSKEYVSTRSS